MAMNPHRLGEMMQALEKGTVMIKFRRRRPPEKRVLALRTSTFEILQFPLPSRGRPIAEDTGRCQLSLLVVIHISASFSVDLREIKEIRDSMGSLDFKSNTAGQAKIADPQCCFIIYYGSEFKLKTLSVAGV